MLERRLQRDERSHAVPDERGPLERGRFDERRDPARPALDRRAQRARAAAMAREIDREHRVAVVSEVARLPLPDAVIERRAVDEDDRRKPGIELASAGVRVCGIALDDELHGYLFLRSTQPPREIFE